MYCKYFFSHSVTCPWILFVITYTRVLNLYIIKCQSFPLAFIDRSAVSDAARQGSTEHRGWNLNTIAQGVSWMSVCRHAVWLCDIPKHSAMYVLLQLPSRSTPCPPRDYGVQKKTGQSTSLRRVRATRRHRDDGWTNRWTNECVKSSWVECPQGLALPRSTALGPSTQALR